jgi:hypothetical protein
MHDTSSSLSDPTEHAMFTLQETSEHAQELFFTSIYLGWSNPTTLGTDIVEANMFAKPFQIRNKIKKDLKILSIYIYAPNFGLHRPSYNHLVITITTSSELLSSLVAVCRDAEQVSTTELHGGSPHSLSTFSSLCLALSFRFKLDFVSLSQPIWQKQTNAVKVPRRCFALA